MLMTLITMTTSQGIVYQAHQVRFATHHLQVKSSGIVQILLSRANLSLLGGAAEGLSPARLQQQQHPGHRNLGLRDAKIARMTMQNANQRFVTGEITGRTSAKRHVEVAKLVLLPQHLPHHLPQNRAPALVDVLLAVVADVARPAVAVEAVADVHLAVVLHRLGRALAVVLYGAADQDQVQHPARDAAQHPPNRQGLPKNLAMNAHLLRVLRAKSRSIKMVVSVSVIMVEARDAPSYVAVLSLIMEEIVDRRHALKSLWSLTIRTHT